MRKTLIVLALFAVARVAAAEVDLSIEVDASADQWAASGANPRGLQSKPLMAPCKGRSGSRGRQRHKALPRRRFDAN